MNTPLESGFDDPTQDSAPAAISHCTAIGRHYPSQMWRKSISHERLHFIRDSEPLCGVSWTGSLAPLGYETKCPWCQKRLDGKADGSAFQNRRPPKTPGWSISGRITASQIRAS
jgi:hypothetical protein